MESAPLPVSKKIFTPTVPHLVTVFPALLIISGEVYPWAGKGHVGRGNLKDIRDT